jgi:hypothetical protein
MLCPANVLGVILAIRHPLDGIFAFAFASVAAASLFRRAPLSLLRRGTIRRGGCPAHVLGVMSSIRLARTGAALSFRAECPALLSLREAPGHAAEDSLLDVTASSTPTKIGAFVYVAHPAFTG